MNRKLEVAIAVLGTGDASKTIIADPGDGKALVIDRIIVTILTSAAQTLDIEDASGTVEVLKIPASGTGQYVMALPISSEGIKLTNSEALVATPAAAGVGAHIVVVYYKVNVAEE